jgi:hypothetical protein
MGYTQRMARIDAARPNKLEAPRTVCVYAPLPDCVGEAAPAEEVAFAEEEVEFAHDTFEGML